MDIIIEEEKKEGIIECDFDMNFLIASVADEINIDEGKGEPHVVERPVPEPVIDVVAEAVAVPQPVLDADQPRIVLIDINDLGGNVVQEEEEAQSDDDNDLNNGSDIDDWEIPDEGPVYRAKVN